MLGIQLIEVAAEAQRERERVLLRESEVTRLLRGETRRAPAANRLALRLGEALVMLGCWLQQRASVREGAA